MGLVGIWHRNFCRYPTRAILPYDQRLAKWPAYLQQLDMERSGKCVSSRGTILERSSGPAVWGEAGTNGQHAFFQLLHQGTKIIPAEFLVASRSHEPSLRNNDLLKANCLAQSEALVLGRSLEVAAALGYTGDEQRVRSRRAGLIAPIHPARPILQGFAVLQRLIKELS